MLLLSSLLLLPLLLLWAKNQLSGSNGSVFAGPELILVTVLSAACVAAVEREYRRPFTLLFQVVLLALGVAIDWRSTRKG